MDTKTIRFLIYFFLAVIAAFAFFIFLNAVGSRAPAGSPELEQPAPARVRVESPKKGRLAYFNAIRPVFSSSSVRAEGAIMLVKDSGFQGVASPAKSVMELLGGMSGSKKKPLIALKEGDLEKKIGLLGAPPKAPSLSGPPVPGPGDSTAGALNMIKAEVNYMLFTSSQTWAAFAGSHKCVSVKADFSRENVLILVSLSDFPSGIFKMVGLKKGSRELVVHYRVDPLAMSASGDPAERNTYSSTVIPKKSPPIRLEQVQ